ncbi:hypothetical protein GCM10028791_43160 [Echinicola sediminis]
MKNTIDPFKAISDPNRRAILMILSQESHSINSIVENFEMSRPAVSKHVKILHTAGFIHIRKKGRERFCYLNGAGFDEVKIWLNYFDGFWKQKLQKLETLGGKGKGSGKKRGSTGS